ncbi:MarR family winged helix-turn-helix transcriptional regulator [Pseudonocardia lacus]|uniref:MarR family winged helix-turn-helix transcriptional regulator n=1 Tax=Pseudonocardia lacus TaxID=2835865 RepID=UPI001BDC81A3|nr:MarR family transcriptional regulator [Pseudonocardia lacus]
MPALADDIGFLLSRASGLVVRATNDSLAEVGLRVRPYSVLVLACDEEGGISQRDLAATLGLDPSQVVALVDELARRGLVERTPSPADRRTKLVAATARGRELRDRATELAGSGGQQRLGRLTPAEQATLRDLLTRVVDDPA